MERYAITIDLKEKKWSMTIEKRWYEREMEL